MASAAPTGVGYPDIALTIGQIVSRLMSPLSKDETGHRSSDSTLNLPH